MTKECIRITLITEYFPPEIGAGSTRAYENSINWLKRGAQVTVVTGFPDYPDGKIPEKYHGYKFLRENIDGINVIRTFTITAPNKGYFKRIISFISFLFSSSIQGAYSLGKQDIIIATSPPFLVGVSGYIVSMIKKLPLIFEVRDIWPESIIQLGLIKNKFIIKFLELIEAKLYKHSRRIVSVTDSYVDIISKKGIPSSKISVIKNGVNIDFFSPMSKDINLLEKLGCTDKLVISYIGTIGLSHSLDRILLVAQTLSHVEDICFLFVGDGAEKENLVTQANQLKINNVKFVPPVPKEKLISYYSISDILLVPLKNIPLFRNVIPSKIFEIMAMQKPMILSVDGEARKIVEEAGAGFFVQPESVKALTDVIIKLKREPQLRAQLGANGRKYVKDKFDREKLAAEYLKIIMETI